MTDRDDDTQEQLEMVVEELESTNEELMAANQELIALLDELKAEKRESERLGIACVRADEHLARALDQLGENKATNVRRQILTARRELAYARRRPPEQLGPEREAASGSSGECASGEPREAVLDRPMDSA
jgi:peptidoglycan hydrolase CwlO-like protein